MILNTTLNNTIQTTVFILLFIGTNLTFIPLHWLGLQAMPRKYNAYPDTYRGWARISRFGSIISYAALIIFTITIIESFSRRVLRLHMTQDSSIILPSPQS